MYHGETAEGERGQGKSGCAGATVWAVFRQDKIRQEYQDKRKQKATLEKKLQDCEHALERYEAEVLRCLDGESGFSQEMLARLIAKAEAELRAARQEYAKVLQEAEDDRELAQKIKECYRQFCGWAEEFELAPLTRCFSVNTLPAWE